MKKIILIIVSVLFTTFIYSQEKEFKVKKITSPEFGKIPSNKSYFYVSDTLIIVKAKNKENEYKIEVVEENEFSKTYLCNYNSQNEIRFTYFKKDNYMRFENRDNFSGKVGELFYYFE